MHCIALIQKKEKEKEIEGKKRKKEEREGKRVKWGNLRAEVIGHH